MEGIANVTLHQQGESVDICVADTEAEIAACFPAFHELRPHLPEKEFVAQVQRQMKNQGYVLVYISSQGQVVATAGYRVAESLAWAIQSICFCTTASELSSYQPSRG